MIRRIGCLLVLIAALPVAAQTRPAAPPSSRTTPPPAAPGQPAPEPPRPLYEPLMLRLAETIGALSIMSDVCRQNGDAGPVGEEWRVKMTSLIEAEAQTPGLRERLAGAYNRGALTYRTTYRRCTPAGRLALERLLVDGARIAGEISSRFGS